MSYGSPIKIPIVGPAYQGRSRLQNTQQCINWYVELDSAGGKEPAALIPTPGCTVFSALATTGKCRGGMKAQDGLYYVVCGTTLYEITAAGVKTSRGTVAGTGKVWMAENGLGFNEIFIATNTANAYIFNYSTNTLTLINHASFPTAGATTVAFIDGYFIFTEPGTQKVWISALYDGLTYDGTWFKSAESWPDNLVGLAVANRIIYLFGTQTTEIWTNQDLSNFPFGRDSGGLFQVGAKSVESIAQFDTRVYWLASDLTVRVTSGYDSRIISTPAIDYAISRYNQPENAIGLCYKLAGYEFYALTFPGDDVTWVYCVTTNMWHQWQSYGQGRNRANMAIQDGEKVLVGDWASGDVSLLSTEVYEENGQPIVRYRVTPYVSDESNGIFMHSFELDVDTGLTALLEGQGSDPVIGLQYSDDGGRTWSSEIERSLGKQGEYNKRVKWTRLGRFRDRVFRIRVSDPVPCAILGAYAELEQGDW